MKNLKNKLNTKKGFSLVELLVVIAVIGVIAAIAIPALSNVLAGSRDAKARRNAQTIAAMYNSALSAGVAFTPAQTADLPSVIAALEGGVSPTTGAFAGQTFKISTLTAGEEGVADDHLVYVAATGVLTYTGGNDL